jgi:hypothetical protein
MQSSYSLCVCVCIPVWRNECLWNLLCISCHLSLHARFINSCHHTVCMYILSLLENGPVKMPILRGSGSVKALPLQRIHTQQWKDCWTRRFLCDMCRIKEIGRLVLHTACCFIINWRFWTLSQFNSVRSTHPPQQPGRTPLTETNATTAPQHSILSTSRPRVKTT